MTIEEILHAVADGKQLQRKSLSEKWKDVSPADVLTYVSNWKGRIHEALSVDQH